MKLKLLLGSLLLGLAMFAADTGDAWARGGYYRGGYGYGYGRVWNRPFITGNVTRSNGYAMGTRSFQYPGGHGYTRSFNRGCSGSTCSRNANSTSNSGKTWSHSGSITRSQGSANWQTSGTGAYGGTGARQGSCTSGAGCTGNATAVGPGGQTHTALRSLTPNGQGGYNYNATLTGPNGTVTRSSP